MIALRDREEIQKALLAARRDGIVRLEGQGPHAPLHFTLFKKSQKRSSMGVDYLDYFDLTHFNEGYVEAVYRMKIGRTEREVIVL